MVCVWGRARGFSRTMRLRLSSAAVYLWPRKHPSPSGALVGVSGLWIWIYVVWGRLEYVCIYVVYGGYGIFWGFRCL